MEHPSRGDEPPAKSSQRTDDRGYRVLHVDDDPEFTELVSVFLEREDDRFTVVQATSASNGMDELREQPFDCVISDYDMPGCDGIRFLKKVRDEFPDLPFILFTGKGTEEIASEAISAGVTDYLQKQRSSDCYTVLANAASNAIEHYQSVQMVRQRDQKLRAVIERVTDAIVELDPDWRITLVNRQAEKRYGMDEKSLLGRDFWEVFSKALDTRLEEEFRQVMETREATSFVEYIPQMDGRFNIKAYPTYDGGIAFYFTEVPKPLDDTLATGEPPVPTDW